MHILNSDKKVTWKSQDPPKVSISEIHKSQVEETKSYAEAVKTKREKYTKTHKLCFYSIVIKNQLLIRKCITNILLSRLTCDLKGRVSPTTSVVLQHKKTIYRIIKQVHE